MKLFNLWCFESVKYISLIGIVKNFLSDDPFMTAILLATFMLSIAFIINIKNALGVFK